MNQINRMNRMVASRLFLGRAHREAVRPVVAEQRVDAAREEVQIATVRRRVRHGSPRVAVGADAAQFARRAVATARSRKENRSGLIGLMGVEIPSGVVVVPILADIELAARRGIRPRRSKSGEGVRRRDVEPRRTRIVDGLDDRLVSDVLLDILLRIPGASQVESRARRGLGRYVVMNRRVLDILTDRRRSR